MDLSEIPLPITKYNCAENKSNTSLISETKSKSTNGYSHYMGKDKLSANKTILYIPPSQSTTDILVAIGDHIFSLHFIAFKIRGLHFDQSVNSLESDSISRYKQVNPMAHYPKCKYVLNGCEFVFSKFIRWMYEDLENNIMILENDEIACVLEIASQLGAHETIMACLEPIRDFKSPLECCLRIYADTSSDLINRYDSVSRVFNAATNRILIEAQYINCLPNFNKLSYDRFRKLIFHNELNVKDEVSVLDMVFGWLLYREQDEMNTSSEVSSLSYNDSSQPDQHQTTDKSKGIINSDSESSQIDVSESRSMNLNNRRRKAETQDGGKDPVPLKRTALNIEEFSENMETEYSNTKSVCQAPIFDGTDHSNNPFEDIIESDLYKSGKVNSREIVESSEQLENSQRETKLIVHRVKDINTLIDINMNISEVDAANPCTSNINAVEQSVATVRSQAQISDEKDIMEPSQADAPITSEWLAVASDSHVIGGGINGHQSETYNPRHKYTEELLNAVRWERIKKYDRVAELCRLPGVTKIRAARPCVEMMRRRGLEFGRYWSGSRQIYIPESIAEKRPRVHNQVVFTTGGWRSGKPRSLVHIFDPSVKRWYNIPDDIRENEYETNNRTRPYKVSRHVSLTWEHSVYIIGGLDTNRNGVEYVQRYDPETGLFKKLAPMLQVT